jgi:hypothetical protein
MARRPKPAPAEGVPDDTTPDDLRRLLDDSLRTAALEDEKHRCYLRDRGQLLPHFVVVSQRHLGLITRLAARAIDLAESLDRRFERSRAGPRSQRKDGRARVVIRLRDEDRLSWGEIHKRLREAGVETSQGAIRQLYSRGKRRLGELGPPENL